MVHIIKRREMDFIVAKDNRIIYQLLPIHRVSTKPNLLQELTYTEKIGSNLFETQMRLTSDSFQLISLKNNSPQGTQIQFSEQTGLLYRQDFKYNIAEFEKISLSPQHSLVVSCCYKSPDYKKIIITNNQKEWCLEYECNTLKPEATYKNNEAEEKIRMDTAQAEVLYQPFNYKYIPDHYPQQQESTRSVEESITLLKAQISKALKRDSFPPKKILKNWVCYSRYHPKTR